MYTFMLKLCVLLAMAAYPASSLSIKITPRDTVVLGSGGTETREFSCMIDNQSIIYYISSMTLYRHQTNQKVILVRGDFDYQSSSVKYTVNPDLQSRATILGNIDKNNWKTSRVGFVIPVSALRCSDAGTYACEMNASQTVSGQASAGLLNNTQKELKVTALPNDATVTVIPHPSDGETGTINDPISASVDNVYNFECTTNIGRDQTTDITWQYNSELSGCLVAFPGNKTDGAVGGPSDCQYRTSSKTFYTITSIDASRRTLLAIRCTVKVSLPYPVNGSTEYEIQNPPTIYFKVGSRSDQLYYKCEPCKTSDLLVSLVVVTTATGVCLAICIVIIVIQRRQLQKGAVTTTRAPGVTTTLSSVNPAFVNELDTTRSFIPFNHGCVDDGTRL